MCAAEDPSVASAIAAAASDLLTATAYAWERDRGGPLTNAAEALDRAARHVNRHAKPGRIPRTTELRSMARMIALMSRTSHEPTTVAVLQLVYALAGLADALADLRETRQQLAEARAARAAATYLRAYAPQAPAAASASAPSGRQRDAYQHVAPEPMATRSRAQQ
jgi:hypothetical protein